MKKKILIVGMIIAMTAGCMTGCKKKAECFYCGKKNAVMKKNFMEKKKCIYVMIVKKS